MIDDLGENGGGKDDDLVQAEVNRVTVEAGERQAEQDARNKRWFWATLAMIGLSLACVALAAFNVRLVQQNNQQDAEILSAKARLDAAEQIRASEKKAAKARANVACTLSIAGVKSANGIIGNMRKTILDLSEAVTNEEVKQTLIKDAALFPNFPQPSCVPTNPKPSP